MIAKAIRGRLKQFPRRESRETKSRRGIVGLLASIGFSDFPSENLSVVSAPLHGQTITLQPACNRPSNKHTRIKM